MNRVEIPFVRDSTTERRGRCGKSRIPRGGFRPVRIVGLKRVGSGGHFRLPRILRSFSFSSGDESLVGGVSGPRRLDGFNRAAAADSFPRA